MLLVMCVWCRHVYVLPELFSLLMLWYSLVCVVYVSWFLCVHLVCYSRLLLVSCAV